MKTYNYFLSMLMIISMLTVFMSCKNKQKEETMTVKKYDLKDFFKNPEKSGFKISPDGKYISFLAPYEKRMNIHVQEIGSDEIKRITEVTDRDLSGYFWASNNRILFVKDKGGDENFQLYGVNVDGSNLKALTDYEGVKVQIIDDLEDMPEYIIIGMNKRNKEIFDQLVFHLCKQN